MNEVVHHILKSGNLGVHGTDSLPNGVHQHPEILIPACWLKVYFLPVDDNSQVFAEIVKDLPMLQQIREPICDD